MVSETEILLDTSVLVDLLRRFPPAVTWFQSQRDLRFYVSDIVILELYAGCRNRQERDRIDQFRRLFDPLHLLPEDTSWAVETFRRFRLSHGIGILDALIAAPAVRLGSPLLTCNTKHFDFIPNVRIEHPYEIPEHMRGPERRSQ